MRDYQQIGEILIRKGTIAEDQLELALKVRRTSRQRIGQVLISLGYATEQDVAEALAEQFGFQLVDPTQVKPDKRALDILSPHLALTHKILPLKCGKDRLECVMADPIDFPTTDMVSRLAGRKIVLHVAPASALLDAIVDAYSVSPLDRRKPRRHTPKPQVDRNSILEQLATQAASAVDGGAK